MYESVCFVISFLLVLWIIYIQIWHKFPLFINASKYEKYIWSLKILVSKWHWQCSEIKWPLARYSVSFHLYSRSIKCNRRFSHHDFLKIFARRPYHSNLRSLIVLISLTLAAFSSSLSSPSFALPGPPRQLRFCSLGVSCGLSKVLSSLLRNSLCLPYFML